MSSKERLIEATQCLLHEKGYAATSPRDILDRAGVGQGALYHHFRGKPDLAAVAFGRTVDQSIDELDQLFSEGKPPLARVWDCLTHPRETFRGSPVGRMTMEPAFEESRFKEEVGRYFGRLRRLLIVSLEAAEKEGAIVLPMPSYDLASTLVAVIEGGYVLARATGSVEGMDSSLRGAMGLISSLSTK